MPRDAYASLRLPPDLKDDIQQIAAAESRSFSQTLEFLARRGIAQYRLDGLIKPPADAEREPGHVPGEEELAHRMADLVAERLLEKLTTLEREAAIGRQKSAA